jgi:hypothetical protein
LMGSDIYFGSLNRSLLMREIGLVVTFLGFVITLPVSSRGGFCFVSGFSSIWLYGSEALIKKKFTDFYDHLMV